MHEQNELNVVYAQNVPHIVCETLETAKLIHDSVLPSTVCLHYMQDGYYQSLRYNIYISYAGNLPFHVLCE